MTKRKHDENEIDYLRRKLRKLEKRLKKLPAEQTQSLSPTPPPPPHSPPPPPTSNRTLEDSVPQKINCNAEDLTIEDDDGLPEELLLALGTEGEETVERAPEIRHELSARWKKLMAMGLGKEALDQIVNKYPAPANFTTEAPKINPEILASLSELSLKRDRRIAHRQNVILKIMNAQGKILTSVLKGNISSNSIVEHVNDEAKICAQIYYDDSSSRKFFALAGANQTIKDAVRETEPEFIFGKDCAEKIRAAQAIRKTGAQIKNPEHQAQTSTSARPTRQLQPKKQGNWRGPPQQYQHQRARGGHHHLPTTRKYVQPHQNRQDQRRQQHRGRHTYRC